MIGGKASRAKGNRAERTLVRLLQDHGFAAERLPPSDPKESNYVADQAGVALVKVLPRLLIQPSLTLPPAAKSGRNKLGADLMR